MQQRFRLFQITAALAVAGMSIGIQGCVSASDTHAVAAMQAQAVDRLSVESAITNAALMNATGALLKIRVERAASDAETMIITDLIEPGGDADLAALDRLIAQGNTPSNPLVLQVREGRMDVADAQDWLRAYATALANPKGAATRRRLLESMYPVVAARHESAALNTALRHRAEANAMLFADARASAHTLLGAATSDPSIDALVEAAADSWQGLLLGSIEDEEQREAAERLLGSILGMNTKPSTVSTGANQ